MTELKVNVNGHIVDISKASLPITDRGLLFGDGVYEVMAVYQGHVRAFTRHYLRLAKSLEAIDVPIPFTEQELRQLCQQLLAENNLLSSTAKIYLQITRGQVDERTFGYATNIVPNYFIKVTPCHFSSFGEMNNGYHAISHEDIRRSECHIKSICLQPSVLMKQKANQMQAEEAILYRDQYLTEGASSTVFLIKHGTVYTPPLTKHILPGVTRSLVADICKQLQIPLVEQPILYSALFDADEIWISSTTRTIKPIVKLDDKTIGSGQSGPLWHKVITSYLNQMESRHD